jgi:hypothetical protein
LYFLCQHTYLPGNPERILSDTRTKELGISLSMVLGRQGSQKFPIDNTAHITELLNLPNKEMDMIVSKHLSLPPYKHHQSMNLGI